MTTNGPGYSVIETTTPLNNGVVHPGGGYFNFTTGPNIRDWGWRLHHRPVPAEWDGDVATCFPGYLGDTQAWVPNGPYLWEGGGTFDFTYRGNLTIDDDDVVLLFGAVIDTPSFLLGPWEDFVWKRSVMTLPLRLDYFDPALAAFYGIDRGLAARDRRIQLVLHERRLRELRERVRRRRLHPSRHHDDADPGTGHAAPARERARRVGLVGRSRSGTRTTPAR
jgi:hypothetical protein